MTDSRTSDRHPQASKAVSPLNSISLSYLEARSLKRQLLLEQQAGFNHGSESKPEDFIPRWPANPKDDRDYASFLFEDYNQRRRRGEQPSVDDYAERFPEHRESLSQLISRHDIMMSFGDPSGSEGPVLGLPEIGDEVFGFRLCGELGRGAFARVFLAEQADLARRPVVLKVSGIDGDEPYTLAQLQHTNVVPIYSIHEDQRAGLRVLCMPYLGGASLSAVLRRLWDGPSPATHGRQLVEALKEVQSKLPVADDAEAKDSETVAVNEAKPLQTLRSLDYVGAAAWLTAQLADGLQHAHDRGVLHRDIKPSNILLGSDGEPMLLDFNLAQKRDECPSKAEATLGGTVAYMPPEHLRALANPSPATVRRVDHRSDIYSLGMVLFETLTGHSPFEQSASYSVLPVVIEAMALERSQAAPSVRKQQPRVSWGMESIIRKCLAPDPEKRYQRADQLADDLRRFLDHRPLKYAPELSRAEQFRKWAYRHPRLTSSASVASVAVVLLIGGVAALVGVKDHLSQAQEKLAVEHARDRQRLYEVGTRRALCLLNTVADLQDHLQEGLGVCENTLGLYGVLERDDWQNDANWQRLNEADRNRLAEDTRELLSALAWGRVRFDKSSTAAYRDALSILDRADRIEGLKPSKAMWMDRARYLEAIGEVKEANEARQHADALQPASARDHYMVATVFARKGDHASLQKAIAELNIALHLNPHHYWSWVQRGICYQELGESTLAAGDFGTCIGLWPEFSWGYFNRGYALNQSGLKPEAIDSYSAALKRDAQLLPAYVNRGLARLDLKQYSLALADFDRAMQMGRADGYLHAGRGVALEGLKRSDEADAAFEKAFATIESRAESDGTRVELTYAFAVSHRLPDKARAIFERLLRNDPKDVQALYGMAILASEQDDPWVAMQYLDRAVAANPRFVDAYRHRALLWARQREFVKARDDINWCLEREPRSGVTLYTAACIASHVAERSRDADAANQALDFLAKAIHRGYGRDRAGEDPDLAGIRKNPSFQ